MRDASAISLLHVLHVGIKTVERGTDQNRVMNGRADLNAAFGPQAAGQPKHFGAVCLHGEVTEEAVVCILDTRTRQPKVVCRLLFSIA